MAFYFLTGGIGGGLIGVGVVVLLIAPFVKKLMHLDTLRDADELAGTAELAERLSLPIIGPHPGDQFWIDGLPQQSVMFGFPPAGHFTPTRWLADGDIDDPAEAVKVAHQSTKVARQARPPEEAAPELLVDDEAGHQRAEQHEAEARDEVEADVAGNEQVVVQRAHRVLQAGHGLQPGRPLPRPSIQPRRLHPSRRASASPSRHGGVHENALPPLQELGERAQQRRSNAPAARAVPCLQERRLRPHLRGRHRDQPHAVPIGHA